jgi:hypothetical protein
MNPSPESLLPLCDINLVLITQIGFVTMVEHEPAVTDAYVLDSHQLSLRS